MPDERVGLWVPNQGHDLDTEYPTPSTAELTALWQDYLSADGAVEAAPGVYGALRVPNTPPDTYVSVDICEVVRESSAAVRSVEDVSPRTAETVVHPYADGLSIANYADIVRVARVVMNHDLVKPVEEISEIGAILEDWHEHGFYIIANTSTLPGCEPGTLEFFAKHLPAVFDGLVLPRNFDGNAALSKGIAARNVTDRYSPREAIVTAHIDDMPHHTVGYREAFAHLPVEDVATFQPLTRSHKAPDAGSTLSQTPLGSFVAADAFLRDRR